MSETKFTIQFDGWAPDLGNVSMQMPGPDSPLTLPCADVLNVYYQDGAYRCMPSPAPTGQSVPAPCLSAFTYYDNVASQEIIFAGTANNLYAVDATAVNVPIEASVSVLGTGVALSIIVKGTIVAKPVHINITQGTGTGSGGFFYTGTMVSGVPPGGNEAGYYAGNFGSLSPTTSTTGVVIKQLWTQSVGNIGTTFVVVGTYPRTLFSLINVGTFTGFLTSSGASNFSNFTQGGVNYTQWTWPFISSFGGTQTVKIIQ